MSSRKTSAALPEILSPLSPLCVLCGSARDSLAPLRDLRELAIRPRNHLVEQRERPPSEREPRRAPARDQRTAEHPADAREPLCEQPRQPERRRRLLLVGQRDRDQVVPPARQPRHQLLDEVPVERSRRLRRPLQHLGRLEAPGRLLQRHHPYAQPPAGEGQGGQAQSVLQVVDRRRVHAAVGVRLGPPQRRRLPARGRDRPAIGVFARPRRGMCGIERLGQPARIQREAMPARRRIDPRRFRPQPRQPGGGRGAGQPGLGRLERRGRHDRDAHRVLLPLPSRSAYHPPGPGAAAGWMWTMPESARRRLCSSWRCTKTSRVAVSLLALAVAAVFALRRSSCA